MVLETEPPRVYADWRQIELLRKRKKEGTLGKLQLTEPLWLRKEIAAELGYNTGEDDFLLEPLPTEVRGVRGIGRIPQPTIEQPTIPTPPIVPTKITPRPLPTIPPPRTIIPSPPQAPALALTGDYGRLYQEYQRTGGTLDVVSWGAAGAPLRAELETEQTDEGLNKFLADLAQAGQVSDVENILRAAQIPEEEIDQIVGVQARQAELAGLVAKTFPALDLEGFVDLVKNDPDGFIEQIQQGGYTSDKENLLRLMGTSPEEIDKIIPPWWTLDYWKQAFFKPYGGKDLKGKLAASFIAGIGNVISTTGGAARWLGQEDVGRTLSTIGTTLAQVAPPDVSAEFNWEDVFLGAVKAVPFALSFLPLAIGGWTAGGAVAAALGIGRIGSMIIGGLTGAALSRPLESAMEAGGAYDDAIARGKTEAEAKKEADEVFRNNMTLAGADAFEIAIALAPTPKWVPASLIKAGLVRTTRIGGKMVIVGLSEGGEELYQDMITRHARGEEWQLDPVSKEVFAIGMVMGLGGGLGGDVLSGVVDKAKTKMSGALKSQFNRAVADFKAAGFTQEQAEFRALDAIAETPEGEKVISEAIKEVAPQPGKIAPEAKAPEVVAPEVVKPPVTEKPLVKEAVTEVTLITPEVTPEKIQQQIDDLRKQLRTVPRGQPAKKILDQIDNLEGQLARIKQNELLAGKTADDFEIKQTRPSPLGGKLWSVIDKKTGEELSASSSRALAQRNLDKILRQVQEALAKPKAPEKVTPVTPEVKPSFIVDTEGKIARVTKWDNEGNPSVIYPGKSGGIEERTGLPFAYKPEEGWRLATPTDFSRMIRPSKSAEMIDLRMWQDELSKSLQAEKRLYPMSAKERRREIIEARIKRGETVPPKLLAEFPDLAIPEAKAVPEAPEVTITTPTGEKIPSTITEAPVPTEGATARVFSRIQTEYAETGFSEKVKQGWHHFNIKMVDDLDPIKRIVDQLKKGDVQLSIDENPYLLARLLRGVTSKATTFLEYGTFGKNFYKVDKQGKASPNYTGEPLQNILNEVKDPVKWRDFSTYLTARRAVELSARDIETGIEVNDARASITELEAKYPEFKGLAQRIYKYQDSLLVYAREMGLLSEEMLGKLRKYGNYVPFYRVFNELQSKGLFGKKMANVANPIKRIKGSEREIINPLESIVKNTYVLVNAADRNQVGIAIANLVDKNPELADVFERVKTPIARVARVSAKELGVEIEGLTEAEEEQMVDIFRPSFFVRGDEVTVLIDGKKNYYRVDADLRDSLLRLDRESLGLLGKWLGAPARWLRAGATLSPDFMFRNPARDQLTAFAYSNYGFMPGIDFVRGLASMLRKDADYQLFRMSGAEHSMLVSMDRSYLQKTFKQIVEGKGFTEYVKHPMELLRIVSELGEKATRLGEFKKGIQSGAVPLEAGYSARSVTLDFAQAGTAAQAINTYIAFFNANIRGWGRLGSSFKEHPIRTSAKVFIGITLPSILLWAVNHDDERWKEIPQWQKDLFWIVFTDENIYRIPKPFELGILFGSVPERFLDWLIDRDPDLLKDLSQTLMEAGSPGFIPTAGLPIIEWMTNYSFFRGRAIVPKSRQAMPAELQYTPWTSEVSKKLGELLKLPPAQIDNLLFAWTGGLGRYATDILDGILKKTGISPDIPEPSPTLADIPVIKAFVVRSPYGSSSEAVNDFYDFLEKYEAGEKYLKEMLILGELEKYNKYKAAHPELFFFADFDSERYKEAIEKGETPKDVYYSSSARYLRRVASQLSEISKKEDLIYKDKDMSPEKKRQLIDEMEILKTDIARKAVDLLQQKEPPILQERINEVVGKLGQVIEEGTPLSLEKPDIFTIPDAYREFDSILEGATEVDLKGLKGIDPLAFAYLRKEAIEKALEPILNKQVKDIDFNLKEGVTFEDYYKQWQLGLVKDSPLDKISRRQVELLRKYEASDNKKAFLKGLTEEEKTLLTENPQKEWLKSRSTENAEWALAGKAPLYTKEAYNEFKRLIKELDIPDNAIPEQTLPPEGSIDTHFTRQDMVTENKDGSWEDQLLLKQDYLKAHPTGKPQAGEPQSYLEWKELQLPDTPLASLLLKTEKTYRETYLKLDDKEYLDTLDDKEKDKEGKTARDRYIADLKATKIGDMTYIDIDRKIKAIEKGTDETPISDEIVNAYVSHYQIVDKTSGNSAEAKLNRYDNSELNDFMMNEDYWGTQKAEPLDEDKAYLDNYLVPGWRIDVKYRKEDAEYQAILDKFEGREESERAKAYLAANDAYRKDRRRRQAYGLTHSITGYKFPTAEVENFVAYNEIPMKGFRRERFLIETFGFGEALFKAGQIADLPDPAKVPAVQFDDIYDQFPDQFDEIEGNGKPESEWFEPDPIKRAARDKELRFDPSGKLTAFGLAEIRRNAYGALIPETYTDSEAPTNPIDDYVGYYTIMGEGKPKDYPEDITYWEDDWFMMEHPDFYKEVYLNPKYWDKPHKRKDYRLVPTREVGAKYLVYLTLKTQFDRDKYRLDNPDLDEWGSQKRPDGSVFIWTETMTEKRRRLGISGAERIKAEIEERMRKLKEAVRSR